MRLVVDASVAIKWFLGERPHEPHAPQAQAGAAAIERSGTTFFAPCHWTAEVIAVIARLDPGIVDDALVLLDDMKPVLIHTVAVVKRAADLSVALNHHLFDTLYHAVALEEGATLVTADEAYFGKAKDLGAILPLAEFLI